MRFLVVSVLLFTWLQNPLPTPRKTRKPPEQQSASAEQPANSEQRGTDQSPIVVKILQPPKSQAEIDREAEDHQQKATNDRRTIVLTACLAFIALGQLGVYLYQAIKLRETVEASGQQSAAMERHIGEAARAATAMEKIATVIQSGNAATTRAYLSVIIGGAVFQERQDVIKFEGKPSLVNTGNTAAKKRSNSNRR